MSSQFILSSVRLFTTFTFVPDLLVYHFNMYLQCLFKRTSTTSETFSTTIT